MADDRSTRRNSPSTGGASELAARQESDWDRDTEAPARLAAVVEGDGHRRVRRTQQTRSQHSGSNCSISRCAIYTRKSSEEGLEQDFNSLDAQREACEAYIASQKSEEWRVIGEAYDGGGYSGGTMDRPALEKLLADIGAGKIDTVVVYKVDRLTRSLSDFARIVDVFDGHGVSFVSVTQSFNTTTSMGRLTLNMLLSFAQFEREVTGERIRDKIAASKQKGMWMGGMVPLGCLPCPGHRRSHSCRHPAPDADRRGSSQAHRTAARLDRAAPRPRLRELR